MSRSNGKDAHAYLLSLLPVPHPCPLSHFVNYFVPLSENMFNLQQSATEAGRNSEAKMWEVLIGQIWSGLVGYCHAPRDLPEVRSHPLKLQHVDNQMRHLDI